MLRFIICFIIALSCQICIAQIADVKDHGLTDIEFDKEKIIKVYLENAAIVDPSIIRLVETKGPGKIITNSRHIELKGEIKKDEKGKKYIEVVLPPLQPNRGYGLGIYTQITGKSLRYIIDLYDSIHKKAYPAPDIAKYKAIEDRLIPSRKVLKKNNRNLTKAEINLAMKKLQKVYNPTKHLLLEYVLYKYGNIQKLTLLESVLVKKYSHLSEDLRDRKIKDDLNLSRQIQNIEQLQLKKKLAKSIKNDLGFKKKDVKNIIDQIDSYDFSKIFNALHNYKPFAITYRENNLGSSIYDFSSIYKALEDFSLSESSTSKITFKQLIKCIKSVSLVVAKCQCLDTKTIIEKYDGFAKKIENLLASNSDIDDLVSGIISINDLTQPVSANDLEKRLINLKSNISFIAEVRFLYRNVSYSQDSENSCAKTLKEFLGELESSLKNINQSLKTLRADSCLATYKWLDGQTHIESIETEAQSIVIPDYGVVFSNPGGVILRPYFGVNISVFGPINRDVKYRDLHSRMLYRNFGKRHKINTWLRYHLSLHLGTTLGSIKKDEVRDDLFGSNNILSGISFRLDRRIRLSSGVMWYEWENPNPLIDETKVNANCYLSLSFDLSIKNAASNISGILFK